jgi:hypothetical protein
LSRLQQCVVKLRWILSTVLISMRSRQRFLENGLIVGLPCRWYCLRQSAGATQKIRTLLCPDRNPRSPQSGPVKRETPVLLVSYKPSKTYEALLNEPALNGRAGLEFSAIILSLQHQCLPEQPTPLTFPMTALLPDGRVFYGSSIFFPSPDAVPYFIHWLPAGRISLLSQLDVIVGDAFKVLVRHWPTFGAQEQLLLL